MSGGQTMGRTRANIQLRRKLASGTPLSLEDKLSLRIAILSDWPKYSIRRFTSPLANRLDKCRAFLYRLFTSYLASRRLQWSYHHGTWYGAATDDVAYRIEPHGSFWQIGPIQRTATGTDTYFVPLGTTASLRKAKRLAALHFQARQDGILTT